MTAKWLEEHDTREKVGNMIVMEQFVTMILKEIRVWVKEHKPDTSRIAGKLPEDYQEAKKTAGDNQVRSKQKPLEKVKHWLVFHIQLDTL